MTLPTGIIKTDYLDGSARYHNGSIFDGIKPVNIGPYSDRGVTVASHYWNSWWRYRPKLISVVRSPAEIVAANQMFSYGNMGLPIGPVGNFTFKGPMDAAGLTVYMPTTGERAEIGLITDPSALFMLGGTPQSMIAWAQANDTCPHHFRDETTGKPIDLLKYPVANANDVPGLGIPWLPKGLPDPLAPTYTEFGGGWKPQQAHFYEMSYVAYLATLDIGTLENVQYNANFTVLCDAWISAHRNIATVYGELRGIAWAFRNLFMAHTATKDAESRGILPDTCHPSIYWKTLLDNQLAYYTATYMADPTNQVFRIVNGPGQFAPWQCDYMLEALAFGVLSGHSEWAPLYLWALKNAIDRTRGGHLTDGAYPVGLGVAYYLNTSVSTWADAVVAGVPGLGGAEALTAAEITTLTADPFNGGKPMRNPESLMATRAVLVEAQYLHAKKLANVKTIYPELDTCVINVERMLQGSTMNPRQSVVLDVSGIPDIIPPLPPVITPQPPTEIHMSDTKLAVGETKHITLAVTPADADQTGLIYTATPDGLGTLAPDQTGVAVTRIAKGTITIEADLNGLKATAEALDAIPLADAIALSWDS